MKKLAQKLLDEKRNKAVEMVGKKFEMNITRKAISIDAEKKTVTFVMSTCNVDRHGDVINQDSWILDYFRQSPMFFLQHRSDEFPIGKWIDISLQPDPDNIGKNMLVGTAQFATDINPEADTAFKMVEGGFMSAVSVGFIPHRVDYDEITDNFVLYDCELLECSLVGVGSNRQALAKENDEAREKMIEANFTVCAMHGEMEQSERDKIMKDFRAGTRWILRIWSDF